MYGTERVMSETELIQKWKRARIIWKDIAGYQPLSDEETLAEVLEVVSFHNLGKLHVLQ